MKVQLTDRNTQIIAAYVAGNSNKTELARCFGVSASTIRRVLTGMVMAVSVVPMAQASLSDDFNNGISNQDFTAKWEAMTATEQAAERADLRAHNLEDLLNDLGDNVNQHAPDKIIPSVPQAQPTPVKQQIPQAIPDAIPQATPHLNLTPPKPVVQVAPDAPVKVPQAVPAINRVPAMPVAQAIPDAVPQATPHLNLTPPKPVVQVAPDAPQKTPEKAVKQSLLAPPKPAQTLITSQTPVKTLAQVTSTPAPQPVVQSQIRSTYYDKQITELNAEAEQNHAQMLAESHSRAAGDANTLKQANDYTNKKFSDLKSEVEDNKDEANAGTASALAATGIPQVEAGSDFMVGAGAGTYGNQSAIAVGVSGHLTSGTVTKLAVTGDTNSGFGASAGIGLNF